MGTIEDPSWANGEIQVSTTYSVEVLYCWQPKNDVFLRCVQRPMSCGKFLHWIHFCGTWPLTFDWYLSAAFSQLIMIQKIRKFIPRKSMLFIYTEEKFFLKKACFFNILIWLSSLKVFFFEKIFLLYIYSEHLFACCYMALMSFYIICKRTMLKALKRGYFWLLAPFCFLYF